MTHKEGRDRAEKLIDQDVHTPQETTELLRHLVKYIGENMVTRENLEKRLSENNASLRTDINKEIKASEQRVMDHTTRECAKVRGDLVVSVRKEDEKIDEFVHVVAANGGMSSADRLRLERLGPSPKLT